MTFFLGRQATLGHEPPTIARSTTTVFWPWLANVQPRSLPATPLPMIRFSTCSVLMRMLLLLNDLYRISLTCLPGVSDHPERISVHGHVLNQKLTCIGLMGVAPLEPRTTH